MPEWLRWTDVILLLIVALAFTVAMKHCMHAQRKMRVSTPKHSKTTGAGIDGSPTKLV
jgi:hypothetical protein